MGRDVDAVDVGAAQRPGGGAFLRASPLKFPGEMSMVQRSRRDLFKVGGAAAFTVGLAACASAPAAPKAATVAQPTAAPATAQPTSVPAAQPTTAPAPPQPTQAAQAPRATVPIDQRTLVMVQLG